MEEVCGGKCRAELRNLCTYLFSCTPLWLITVLSTGLLSKDFLCLTAQSQAGPETSRELPQFPWAFLFTLVTGRFWIFLSWMFLILPGLFLEPLPVWAQSRAHWAFQAEWALWESEPDFDYYLPADLAASFDVGQEQWKSNMASPMWRCKTLQDRKLQDTSCL